MTAPTKTWQSIEWLHHYRNVSDQRLTIVDVETTGNRADRCRITEISVLEASLQDGILEQQTYLLNPQVQIPEFITRYTGITQAMVDEAPPTAEVLPQCLQPLNRNVLMAHNLTFDYAFLREEYRRLGVQFTRPAEFQLCTVQLARFLLADLPSRSLPNLVKHFGFHVGRSHRAAADTLACWLLAKHLLTEIQQQSDAVLLERFAQQQITLQQAADLLQMSQKATRKYLQTAEISFRESSRNAVLWYRRGDIEALLREKAQL